MCPLPKKRFEQLQEGGGGPEDDDSFAARMEALRKEEELQMSRWDSPGPFIKSRRPLSGGSSRDEKWGSVSAVS